MSERSAKVRLAHAIALAAGLLVLLFSVGTSVVATRDSQRAAQDDQLHVTLGEQVDAVQSYFERARTIDLLTAANPAFIDFYRAPGSTADKIRAGGPLMKRVNNALAYLETLFPGRISEACFIDGGGAEIARVVAGRLAKPSELSAHENHNSFFAPTLAIGAGKVYQAPEYVSPDTHEQVISNSTTVTAAGHTGLVHFEITLDSFRMAPSAAGVTASIIDAAGHRVILDSRTPLTSGMPVDQSLTRLAGLAREQGLLAVGADRVAFRRLPSAKGNANNWYVAVAMPSFDAGWTHGLSVRSVALLLAALVTILICVVSGWRQLRTTRRAAYHDVLTGLPNRALLVQRVQASQRTGQPSAVLVLDLEQFKEVNDLLGQSHGDRLLRQIAERLVGIAPTGATVARLGGDDFAMFLPGTDLSAAETAARQCLDALHRTFLIDGTGLDLEARIGVACSPEHGTDAHTLLRHADTAMYLAKEGHDGCRTYDTAVEQHAPKRLALLGDLRRALEADDQITLHYQPKVGIAHGHLAGVEALVRWQHPQLGRIAPDAFIPLAETTTLIHALTTRVLETAVRQARQWQDEGLDIPVAVNLSTRCLHDPGLPDRVFDLLRRTGLPAALLELEITESMVMSDPEQALTVLHALHDGGIRLSVDDFGTGHSSMAYLQRMPVDELKIDKSFVQHLLERDENSVLVRSAITLGHNLGLSVVAEGVEDEATVDLLRDLDCDVVQGYHFARPMAADDLRAWLRTRTTAVH